VAAIHDDTIASGLIITMSISSTGEITNSIPTSDDAKVNITFLDANSQPLANELINVSATSGVLSQDLVLTDSDGVASVSIVAPNIATGTEPGIFTATPVVAGDEDETFREAKTIKYQFVATTIADTPTEAAGSVASLQFLSAEPTVLSLKGTGGVGYGEISELIFKVVDSENNPISGVQVNFKLTTSVGGLALNQASTISNEQGEAKVTVLAGTVATPVRVTASVVTPTGEKSVQSDLLKVVIGIPDQNSFSLAVDKIAPEGWDRDGETISFTARLADRNNNPVPDGTVVVFTTEGGVIEPSCETVNGVCSVTWTSQDPRPLDHRSTVLAYAIGHETFYDVNGSGIFDDGDTFDDLGEAFRDDDESGAFNPTENVFSRDEKLIDYDLSGDYSAGDGVYNGIPCNHSTDCPVDANNLAGRSTLLINLIESFPIIMADSSPIVHLYELLPGHDTCLNANGHLEIGTQCQDVSPLFATGLDSKRLWVMIEDTAVLCKTSANGTRIDGVVDPSDPLCLYAVRQSAPTDSSISVSTAVGKILGETPTKVPNQLEHEEFVFTVQSIVDNAEAVTDVLAVTVTPPVETNPVSQAVTLTDPAN